MQDFDVQCLQKPNSPCWNYLDMHGQPSGQSQDRLSFVHGMGVHRQHDHGIGNVLRHATFDHAQPHFQNIAIHTPGTSMPALQRSTHFCIDRFHARAGALLFPNPRQEHLRQMLLQICIVTNDGHQKVSSLSHSLESFLLIVHIAKLHEETAPLVRRRQY